MWRMTPQLAIATLTVTLTLAVSMAPKADASTVLSDSYSTSASISGMTGNQPISFFTMPGGTLTQNNPFALGEFITNPLPATATLTYDHTPFVIDLKVGTSDGSGVYDYKISGMLNGSITGAGSSNMFALITSIQGDDLGTGATPPFAVTDLLIAAPLAIQAPNGNSSGFSTLNAVVVPGIGLPAPAPEPTSIAVFGAALGAWAIRRRSRSKARA
jgi:hypothetical protein